VADKAGAVRRVVDALAGRDVSVEELDGTTLSCPDEGWWFNLRPSNTEPFLRLNVEAKDPATMERVRDRVLDIVRV
jgi:phosphomannomutase